MAFDLRAALEGVKGRGPLLILTHDNPDPDSLACALGLQAAVVHAGVSATIGLGGIIGRAENRAMVRELSIDLVPLDILDFARFPLIGLVDTQPGTGNNSLPAGRRCDIVIDHHPPRPSSRQVPWQDIREGFAASMMIPYAYLRELGHSIDQRLATAFVYALKSETRDLGRESGPEERAAYLELFPLADHERLNAIAGPKLGREHFIAVDRALRAAEVRDALVTVELGQLVYPDLVAEVADMLLDYDRAHWVLCVGQHEGSVFLSVRTDVTTGRAGELIRRVLGSSGAGGGHGMVAGGRLHEAVRDEWELKRVYERLVARMAGELRISAPPVPLLS